ncbi:MAG: FecR family protein [Clostridiales bacterium]|jgi:hypothetical protein|nr:FecR family protein [Clostridiales bacterium]
MRMGEIKKRIAAILTGVAIIAAGAPAYAADAAQAARTISIHEVGGKVTFKKGTAKEYKAKEGIKLYDGYTVLTGADSHAYLQLDDKSMVKLSASSEATVSKAGKNKISISLVAGALGVAAEKQTGGKTFETHAGATMLSIRGTTYTVEYKGDLIQNDVVINMLEGEGEVDGKTLPAGRSMYVGSQNYGTDLTDYNKDTQVYSIKQINLNEASAFTLEEIYENKERVKEAGVFDKDAIERIPETLQDRQEEQTKQGAPESDVVIYDDESTPPSAGSTGGSDGGTDGAPPSAPGSGMGGGGSLPPPDTGSSEQTEAPIPAPSNLRAELEGGKARVLWDYPEEAAVTFEIKILGGGQQALRNGITTRYFDGLEEIIRGFGPGSYSLEVAAVPTGSYPASGEENTVWVKSPYAGGVTVNLSGAGASIPSSVYSRSDAAFYIQPEGGDGLYPAGNYTFSFGGDAMSASISLALTEDKEVIELKFADYPQLAEASVINGMSYSLPAYISGGTVSLYEATALSVTAAVENVIPIADAESFINEFPYSDSTVTGKYELLSDITLTSPLEHAYFGGELDGNGHTITINFTEFQDNRAGIFQTIEDGGYVHDLNIAGTTNIENADERSYAGTIAATVRGNLKIENVTSSVNMKVNSDDAGPGRYSNANGVGGITGAVEGSGAEFIRCVYTGSINADTQVTDTKAGGIIGSVTSGSTTTLEECFSSAKISTESRMSAGITDFDCVGGLIGAAYGGSVIIRNCEVSGADINGNFSGGLVGYGYSNVVTISNSVVNASNIRGASETAGIATGISSGSALTGNAVVDSTITGLSGYITKVVCSSASDDTWGYWNGVELYDVNWGTADAPGSVAIDNSDANGTEVPSLADLFATAGFNGGIWANNSGVPTLSWLP